MTSFAGVFLSLLVLSFGAMTLFSGLFTAYFGAGKSRKIGLTLTLVGLVVIAFFATATWNILPGFGLDAWTVDDMLVGLVALVASGIGGVVALALFLASIMKA